MGFSFDLLINALIAGILLGGFYTAVTIGVSISFGILDIVNIAHPAFIILGSYIAYIVNTRLGIDPIVISIAMLPVFYSSAPASIKSITNHSSGAGRKRCAACRFSSACCSSPK